MSIRGLFSLVLLLAAASLWAADPAPTKEKEKEPPPEKTVTVGQAVGTIENWNDSDGRFTLKMKVRYIEPNQQAQANYVRDLQNLLNRQQNLMRITNPVQRQQEMIKLIQDANNFQSTPRTFYDLKEKEQNVDVEVAEDLKVRVASPPPVFDDKGNIKMYTKEELKELKGDDKLPGFPAERETIHNGQTVMVTFGYKTGGKPAEKKEEEKKDDEKKDNKKKPAAKPPAKALMMLVVGEPAK